jgi:hypothetical protein
MMLTPQVAIDDSVVLGLGLSNGLVVQLEKTGTTGFTFGHPGSQVWGWKNTSFAVPHQRLAAVICANAWDMMAWHNPATEDIIKHVKEFILAWTQCDDRQIVRSRSWPWTLSYAAGLIVAERCAGLLGLHDGLPETSSVDVASSAWSYDPALWVEDAFTAGFDDMRRAGSTMSCIEAFMASDDVRVPVADLQLAFSAMGGQRDFPLPLRFWQPSPAPCPVASGAAPEERAQTDPDQRAKRDP